MNQAIIQCDNDHDKKCVEQDLDSWLKENKHPNEAMRFAIGRLIEQSRSFQTIKNLLK